jgi:hypothetical protein
MHVRRGDALDHRLDLALAGKLERVVARDLGDVGDSAPVVPVDSTKAHCE